MKAGIKIICILLGVVWYSNAQNKHLMYNTDIKQRINVVIDNDFGGDPDGLFQLAHQVLSPSVNTKAIIGSQHYKNGFYGLPGDAKYACTQARELLRQMNLTDSIAVYEGASEKMTNAETPIVTEGARIIVAEAMKADKKRPLYVLCGAGLTNIASAYLMEPRIAERIILIWIGGPEYPDLTVIPEKMKNPEYNAGIDIKSVQTIFNKSDIPIWQIPRNTYRQALYSHAELTLKFKNNGPTGTYLMKKLDELFAKANYNLGESYVLGDSPLVLFTALQSSWESDPSSSLYVIKNKPSVNDKGQYTVSQTSGKIRVYTRLDTRLMLDDFYAKLCLYQLQTTGNNGNNTSTVKVQSNN